MRIHHIFAMLLAASLLASCGNLSSAGSGSEAGNAVAVRAFSEVGEPIAEAVVEIRPSSSTERDPLYTFPTGPDGLARMHLPDGAWTMVVRKANHAYMKSILLRDSGIGSTDTISDTLRSVARLEGILEGCHGRTLTAPGVGGRSLCDKDGYFQLDALPSGELRVEIEDESALRSRVRIEPGVNSITLAGTSSLPSFLANLPSDSLIPWGTSRLPASLPKSALPDSGSFSLAVRFRRTHVDTALWAIEWHDSASSGIRIGWRGRDTMVATLNGRTFRTVGIPLDTGIQQIGLSWDGHRIAILRGQDSVLSLTSVVFDQRMAWNPPAFATNGVAKLEWIAFKRGILVEDWLRRLSRM